MAKSPPDRTPRRAASLTRRGFAARALIKPLTSLAGELAGVRAADDREPVHRTRVASRRLRNVLDLFWDALPQKQRKSWRKHLRNVTRALGRARDLDVQLDFLEHFGAEWSSAGEPAARAGLARVQQDLRAARAALQSDVVQFVDELAASGVLGELRRWTRGARPFGKRSQVRAPALRSEACRAASGRLDELLAYERYARDPERSAELHEMRIAAKHLRYTLETYQPLFAGGLEEYIAWARGFQEVLGELHDCDVWIELLGDYLKQATPAETPGIRHLLADRQRRRVQLYEQFIAAWDSITGWRTRAALRALLSGAAPEADAPLLREFDPQRVPRLAPVLSLARQCHWEAGHAQQVTRCALRLFDELRPVHKLDRAARFWLTAAGLLHDIGWVAGRASHHKTALRIILEAPDLGWSLRQRRIVGAVARYHRGRLPHPTHADYTALPRQSRNTVRCLAALLRVADGLDYRHRAVVQDLTCRVEPGRIVVQCRVREPAAVEAARARLKSDLARRVFRRAWVVRWRAAVAPAATSS